jgi:glycosyltransferase involved in cell wall biosynthesis
VSARPLHVCFIASEFFGFGIAGGFGFATRSLGRELVSRGHRVTAVIPRPRNLEASEAVLDGITVRTYPRNEILRIDALFAEVDADIYHSQEPSLSSYVAQRAAPGAVHVVTSRDPRDFPDWCIEFAYPSHTRLGLLRTMAFYENPYTHRAVRGASRVVVPAKCLAVKVQRKYRLRTAPEFLPTPVTMPAQTVTKAERPTVCYVGRLDRRKRPDLFFNLAPRFPEIDFLVAGGSQDPRYADELDARFGKVPNLHLLGFVDQFASDALSRVFSASWIMVNSAAREGLPNVFVEAAAHGCAIVSPHDPDGFASQFGRHCPDQDFETAIRELLREDQWRERGRAGAEYVLRTNASPLATARHEAMYMELLQSRQAR